jgi:hypothetical protein
LWVQQLLQCWCLLMQQQLQLVVISMPAATAGATVVLPADAAAAGEVLVPPDAAAAAAVGSDYNTGTVGNKLAISSSRLKTISSLLALLVAASNGSMYLGAVEPWHGSLGHEVLQLLEQYVRTTLSRLQFSSVKELAAGGYRNCDGTQLRHRQQQQLGTGEVVDAGITFSTHAGLHAWIYSHTCPCCLEKPDCIQAALHRQLAAILPQLFEYRGGQLCQVTPTGTVLPVCSAAGAFTMRPGPLLQASCEPGPVQQQLLSLLFSIRKRVQIEFADHAYSLVKGPGACTPAGHQC